MTTDREAFLAGDRPDDVHIYLHEDAVSNVDALESHGERVEAGIVLVLDGDQARSIFQRATGIDPMAFAQDAMDTDGDVDDDCTGGTCPACGADDGARFVFAFAEAQNDDVGGLYAEGDVIHAYVSCECGESYSDKWVAE
ncbi:DUF5807 family protein [Halovenus marina]|uniref:DUF5807 family protein n=1 Tax=Halovenus marina TaxID=3396621 RepID=UPI003F54723D